MDEAARLIADQPARSSSSGSAAAGPSTTCGRSCPTREIFAFDRAISAHPEVHPRRRSPDPRRDPRDAEILRAAHSRQARLHPRRSRLRRSDAGPDHALLAFAARRRMVGARHDHPRGPAARRNVPRAAAAAGLPEVRPRPAPRGMRSRSAAFRTDAHRLLRAAEAARSSGRLGRPRHGARADRARSNAADTM